MRRSLIIGAIVLTTAGCATTGGYGNFVAGTGTLDETRMASDAVGKLVTLYPPAKTQLHLMQPTPDAFGQAFAQGLRASGYALIEDGTTQPSWRTTSAAPAADTATKANTALPVQYILDEAHDMNLYRLTIVVGDQSITRPYIAQDGTAVPTGYWARQE